MKRRPPTFAEAELIHEIAIRVTSTITYQPEHFSWGTEDQKRQAYDLMKSLGLKTPSKPCFSCYLNALGPLLAMVGLEGFAHPSEARRTKRMAICVECPTFVHGTQSCGTLIADALVKRTVTHPDGVTFEPCGCFCPIKTSLKHSQCPANRW